MLGRDAADLLRSRGFEVATPSRAELDITEPAACRRAVQSADVVLNCAGWTAVDAAETAEGSAFAANAQGAANLARASRLAGARVVYISTDYVFDGRSRQPYTENMPLSPCSAYGRSKAAGEWATRAENPDHIVVRTAWLYGKHGDCFPKKIARRAEATERLVVVEDQRGQPTWTVDVADLVVRLLERRVPAGVYHATAGGSATWYEFAQEIVASTGRRAVTVDPVDSDSYPLQAVRPAYSVLGHEALRRLDVEPIGGWRERWRSAAGVVLG